MKAYWMAPQDLEKESRIKGSYRIVPPIGEENPQKVVDRLSGFSEKRSRTFWIAPPT
jgi:hypothetical protein